MDSIQVHEDEKTDEPRCGSGSTQYVIAKLLLGKRKVEEKEEGRHENQTLKDGAAQILLPGFLSKPSGIL